MSVVYASLKYYAWLIDEWVELKVSNSAINADQGILSNDPLYRIAGVGTLDLELLNDDEIYTPGHENCLDGWHAGVRIKEVFTYSPDYHPDGAERIYYWYVPKVDGIQPDIRKYGTRKCKVSAVDWMYYAYERKLRNPVIVTDCTVATALDSIVDSMDIEPETLDFDDGVNTFLTALDITNERTRVADVMSQLAKSEWGMIYLRPGETLTFEDFKHRNCLRDLTEYEGAFTGRTFDGGGTNKLHEISVSHGDALVNVIEAVSYPREKDTAAVVLWKLRKPVAIASGESRVISGRYRNPDGGLKVNGYDMITPAATTDYLANGKSDGTGTNYTASVTVTPVYKANRFRHTVTNNSSVTVWLTRFQCRGYGIYINDALIYETENETSIGKYDEFSMTIDQKYQQDTDYGALIADRELEFNRDPETRINSISFYANLSDSNMMAFISLHAGDKIKITSDVVETDIYYINGVSYQVIAGKIILVTFYVDQFKNLDNGLIMCGLIFDSAGGTNAVDCGVMPYLQNLANISFEAWIYVNSLVNWESPISYYGGTGGWRLFIDVDGKIIVRFLWTNGRSDWKTDDVVITAKGWYHIGFTQVTAVSATAPIVYVNGAQKAVTRTTGSNGGTLADQSGNQLILGNYNLGGTPYAQPLLGWLKNVRIYGSIQDATSFAASYSNGRDWETIPSGGDVSLPLLFWSNFIREGYDNPGWQILDDDHKVIDNQFRIVGAGIGSVTPFTTDSDPAWIKSLLHFDGTNGSTTITDATGKAWTAYGNASLVTSTIKFGTAAIYLDGSGDYIRTADSDDWHLSDDDFQFDCWLRINSLPTDGNSEIIFSQYTDANNYEQWGINNSGGVYSLVFEAVVAGSSTFSMSRTISVDLLTWYHLCFSRVGTGFYMFLDGDTLGAVETSSVVFENYTGYVYIGQSGAGGGYYHGRIDEFRFRKGIGISEDFAVPNFQYGY